MRQTSIVLLLGLLLAITGSEAQAWGRDGHRIVGELAQAALDATAEAAVAELLKGESDPTLAGVSTWADEVRESAPEYRWTVPLHWVNFVPGNCHYNADKMCGDGRCVVDAIDRFSRELTDPNLSRERRRDALKFVVHFVGDVHQPLHAGFAADKGGNDFQISIRREGWNLHSVWDSLLIESLKMDWRSYRERVTAEPLWPDSRSQLPASSPASWAEESCGIVQQDGFYPPKHKISSRYLDAKRPLADQRLKLAGARLAALLNRLLGEQAAAVEPRNLS
jgi:nuclease S1